MCDHEYGQPQGLLQLSDQVVVSRGADRIEPGGRFVQKHNRRVQRQRAGQRGALDHAAGQFGRELGAGKLRQADQPDLQFTQMAHQAVAEGQMFAHGGHDILQDGQ